MRLAGDATHAFDQPTAQILLNAGNGGGFGFPILRDLKLRPKFGMVFPGAVQFRVCPAWMLAKLPVMVTSSLVRGALSRATV
jgi:hypothetical protein